MSLDMIPKAYFSLQSLWCGQCLPVLDAQGFHIFKAESRLHWSFPSQLFPTILINRQHPNKPPLSGPTLPSPPRPLQQSPSLPPAFSLASPQSAALTAARIVFCLVS